ncbi:MAG: V-type ATP synthase subunit D [Waddliaceae bacterium]
MAKIALSKSGLQKEKQRLQLYLKLLPTLHLKRTQLRAEHSRETSELMHLEKEAEKALIDTSDKLPMIANDDIALSGLVKIHSLDIVEKSVVGVKVPYLKEIAFGVADYSMLAKPHWVDAYITRIKQIIEIRIRIKVITERLLRLSQAVRRITRHVNLFEKVLIPMTTRNIHKIQIVLGDAERNAVIRAKMAKMHLHQTEDVYFAETQR